MKTIAITMGEPGGIGPEIALRAASATMTEGIRPVLVGDLSVFKEAEAMLNETGKAEAVLPFVLEQDVEVVDTGGAKGYTRGAPSSAGGSSSHLAIIKAAELALAEKADAVATAPISKEALRMAGLDWPGHTEMLATFTKAPEFAMMLVGGGLRVMLVTIHKAIKDVPGLVTQDAVYSTLILAEKACRMLGLSKPRIAVCGLNPHAGEGGLFGTEEAEAITPAIEKAQAEGIAATGPYPADSLFFRAHRGEFDLVVSMYHDQGLVPLKLVGFDTGVNVTVGLPIIRTSPDHGTAYEIAWRGIANPQSMVEAIRLAAKLVPEVP